MDTIRWHFIGIGGAGMSALADALLDLGATVSGSDVVASEATRQLEARGAHVHIGHDAANLVDATQVVVTAAVPEDNPELVEARQLGLPVVKRAALLGQLMDTRLGVAVAGTHGKTTTSAMIAWVLVRAGRYPSYMVGGTIRGLGAGGHWGSGAELVAEADEYDRSFLHLHPEVAVITNIENDHLEYYGTSEAIYAAFGEFALNVRPGGLLILCSDDAGARRLAEELSAGAAPFRLQTYGLSDSALWRPSAVAANAHGGSDYVALRSGKEVARVSLSVPGRHNVLNSLAALAVCVELGIEPGEAFRHLGDFMGAGRRFEVKGEAAGVVVVDDYAHHPTEIASTLQAARQRYPARRLCVLFQPHTYTRTRDFLQDFAASLSAADLAYVTEIFASRERDTLGVSGRDIVSRMTGSNVEFAPTLEAAEQMLLDDLQAGDLLITMGAGDIWKACEAVLSALRERESLAAMPASSERHIPVARPAKRAAWTFTPDIAMRLEEATGLTVVRDEPMSKHDSLRIGGPATLFVAAGTTEHLVQTVLFARDNGVPYMVIGNGTNLLVGDYGIDGLVIHNKTRDISHKLVDEATSIWHVASGVLFSRLARMTCEAGWMGLEWSNSVPGSVGGGIVSNAGAHGKEIVDDLVSISVLTAEGKIEEWSASGLGLGYRMSRFKAHGRRAMSPPEIVLSADITLYRDKDKSCEARMRSYLEERQAKQPQGKSAGSTFKNPPGYSAGYLVEQIGLKGERYGQAQFSPKHANFMMNLGGATAADVLHLMSLAQQKVRDKFGIDLEPEIELAGDTFD